MLDMKVKSVLKIVAYVAAIVIFCYIEGKYEILFKKSGEKSNMTARKILQAEFEVFGLVQGVFFRKNTEDAAKRLGVRGWCMNTKEGTVKGVIEGEEKPFAEMKLWLEKTGSPQSRIDKTEFGVLQTLSDFTFQDFEIRRVPKASR